MAKKSMILKQQKEQKFSTREYNRCKICGRPHAYLLPRACLQGTDPRRKKGKLVIRFHGIAVMQKTPLPAGN